MINRIFAQFDEMSNADKASKLRQMSAVCYQVFAEDYTHWLNEFVYSIPIPVDTVLARFARWQRAHPAPTYAPTYDALTAAYTVASARPMGASWKNALTGAYEQLLTMDGVAVDYDATGRIIGAHIPSATTDHTYHVNGHCTCQAAQHSRPCWHRAAKRLLVLAYELETMAQAA
jgi:hypothetical protein